MRDAIQISEKIDELNETIKHEGFSRFNKDEIDGILLFYVSCFDFVKYHPDFIIEMTRHVYKKSK